MDTTRRSPFITILIAIIAIVVGLLIGFLVLGRFLWPVSWIDAMPLHMSPAYQQDYLRMAIDSYSSNKDVELAKTRYAYLGEGAESVLQSIQANPEPQNPADIESFSSAVQGVTPATAKATGISMQSLLIGLLCVIVILVLFGLLFYFLLRSPGGQIQPEFPAPEEPSDTGGIAEPFATDETLPTQFTAPEPPASTPDLADALAAFVVAESLEETQPSTGTEVEVDNTQEIEIAKMTYDLSYIEGIGEVYASKLKEVGIQNPKMLLEGGATPKGREIISQKTGISHKLILEWVNHVDLYRIKGVGSEYADLLEEAGVDTVVELSTRNPENLYQKLVTVNEEKALVRKMPVLFQVEDWIGQAKLLPRMVKY